MLTLEDVRCLAVGAGIMGCGGGGDTYQGLLEAQLLLKEGLSIKLLNPYRSLHKAIRVSYRGGGWNFPSNSFPPGGFLDFFLRKGHLKRNRMTQISAPYHLPLWSKRTAENHLDFGKNTLL